MTGEIIVAVAMCIVCFAAMAFAFHHEQQAARSSADAIEQMCKPDMTVAECIQVVRGE